MIFVQIVIENCRASILHSPRVTPLRPWCTFTFLKVDEYSLPSSSGDVSAARGISLTDVGVDSTIVVLGDDGEVVEEVDDVTMFFS